MRLQQYITEKYDNEFWNDWWPLIKRKCMPYLKDVKDTGSTNFFSRGMSGPQFQIKDVRTDRRPVDTSIEIHNYWNGVFYKKFGWKPRSEGLFVWSKRGGYVFSEFSRIIFPVGRYKALWSPYVSDLYVNSDADEISEFIDRLEYYSKTPFEKLDKNNFSKDSEKQAEMLKISNFVNYKKIDFQFNQIEKIFKNISEDYMSDTLKIWKYFIEDVVLKTYKETSIREINPASFKSEVILNCKKYYSAKFVNNDDFYRLSEEVSKL